MLLFRRKPAAVVAAEELSTQLVRCRERRDTLLHAVQALCFFVKEFSFDLAEIDARGFQRRIDELADVLADDASAPRVERVLEERKEEILDFIQREERYFSEREAELSNIIELLRTGLAGIVGENKTFQLRVYEGNVRMEQLIHLDDIRKIKEKLQVEVDEMKRAVREKEEQDNRLVESLSEEVGLLRSDLEKVKDVASADPLTGACNRLALDNALSRLIERHTIFAKPCSLLICDLDNFKAINDRYGHQVGDRVLMRFVQECRQIVRTEDLIARYGGDEFVIILSGTPLRHAVKRARNVCKMLAGKRFIFDADRPQDTVAFTVSIGISELRPDDTPAALLERADRALYQAKQEGKNRVACLSGNEK